MKRPDNPLIGSAYQMNQTHILEKGQTIYLIYDNGTSAPLFSPNKKGTAHDDDAHYISFQYLEPKELQCPFKVGDKVQTRRGKTTITGNTNVRDTVELVPGMRQYDRAGFLSSEKGFVLKRNKWEKWEDWELCGVTEKAAAEDMFSCHTAPDEAIPWYADVPGAYGTKYYTGRVSLDTTIWQYDAGAQETSITKIAPQGRKGIMSVLQSIPKRLKRLLDKETEAMYQLGWVDGELDLTEDGLEELQELLFDLHQKELGTRAIKEVADRKKAEKKDKSTD